MDEGHINVNLSIGFTGFSGKPIFTNLSIPLVVPSNDYTIGRILNDVLYRLDDNIIDSELSREDIQKVSTEIKINLKLRKDEIRVNKSGTDRFYPIGYSIQRAKFQEGDTLYAILRGRPLISPLPEDPVIYNISFGSDLFGNPPFRKPTEYYCENHGKILTQKIKWEGTKPYCRDCGEPLEVPEGYCCKDHGKILTPRIDWEDRKPHCPKCHIPLKVCNTQVE